MATDVKLKERLKDKRFTPPSGWKRLEVRLCDLCNRPARWKHPMGGFRCSVCPRPEVGPKEYCPTCEDKNSLTYTQGGVCPTCGRLRIGTMQRHWDGINKCWVYPKWRLSDNQLKPSIYG